MSNTPAALLGISNAIVDVLCNVEPAFIDSLGAPPGSMTLIDQHQAESIYASMGPAIESAGGSVANSVACFASLGGKAGYIGRVADDQLGNIFAHDMQALGAEMRLPPETRNAPTARCHVLITADGERTMQTYLGACVEIAADDINENTVGQPALALLEGYVWDTPEGPAAMTKAVKLAKRGGARVVLSLSDSFCVERHATSFRSLANGEADIVIGNEAEALALFDVTDFETAAAAAAANGRLFVITRSEKGSVVIEGDSRIEQAADTIDNLVDTTGAGDAYVAGFLFGLSNGRSHADSARLGTACASLAVTQVGARPQPAQLKALVTG